MFKNFVANEDATQSAPVKSSVQRSITQTIMEQYPNITEEVMEAVLPKKTQFELVKIKDSHISLIMSPTLGIPVFFQVRDGPYFPTLKFLHTIPRDVVVGGETAMPKLGLDAGGIKFVVKGADVFCAGITSKGGYIPPQGLAANTPVQMMAEGKELPLAVGITKVSTDEMKSSNTGVGVQNLHYLNDDLWKAY